MINPYLKFLACYLCLKSLLLLLFINLNFTFASDKYSFVRIHNALLDVTEKKLVSGNVRTPTDCEKHCVLSQSCLSFELIKVKGRCYTSQETAGNTNKLKKSRGRDYYQRLLRNYSLYFIIELSFFFPPNL